MHIRNVSGEVLVDEEELRKLRIPQTHDDEPRHAHDEEQRHRVGEMPAIQRPPAARDERVNENGGAH